MNGYDTWVAIGTLGAGVVANTAGVAFFLGRLFERTRSHNERIEKLEATERDGDGGRMAVATALTRVEEGLKALKDRFDRAERTRT